MGALKWHGCPISMKIYASSMATLSDWEDLFSSHVASTITPATGIAYPKVPVKCEKKSAAGTRMSWQGLLEGQPLQWHERGTGTRILKVAQSGELQEKVYGWCGQGMLCLGGSSPTTRSSIQLSWLAHTTLKVLVRSQDKKLHARPVKNQIEKAVDIRMVTLRIWYFSAQRRAKYCSDLLKT